MPPLSVRMPRSRWLTVIFGRRRLSTWQRIVLASLALVIPAVAGLVGLDLPALPSSAGQAAPMLGDGRPSRGAPPQRVAGNINDTLRILDGDSLVFASHDGEIRVRLHGIDAPESNQTCRDGQNTSWACGSEATAALRRAVGHDTITCTHRDTDRYNRMIAVCTVESLDLNAWMVANGWAVAYRTYALDYVAPEAQARNRQLGIWRGPFDMPWAWRRGDRVYQ